VLKIRSNSAVEILLMWVMLQFRGI